LEEEREKYTKKKLIKNSGDRRDTDRNDMEGNALGHLHFSFCSAFIMIAINNIVV